MFNLTFTNYSDVNTFAGIVGVEGLLSAYRSDLLGIQSRQAIKDAVELANKTDFCMKSFNDGDSVYEIYVYVDIDNIPNTEYHHTMGDPIKFSELTKDQGEEALTMLEAIQIRSNNKKELCHLVGIDLAN